MNVVDAHTKIGINLAGLVDFAKEGAKLDKKLDELGNMIEKIEKQMAKADYATKTPQAVQTKNTDKLADLCKQRDDTLKMVKQYKELAASS